MKYNPQKEWLKISAEEKIAYTLEYVIRIFKGKYPKLNFNKNSFKDKKIRDAGCGDGRNILLLKKVDLMHMELKLQRKLLKK